MALIRELFPDRDLAPYEILSSWGGYPITVDTPLVTNLPDNSAWMRSERAKEGRRKMLQGTKRPKGISIGEIRRQQGRTGHGGYRRKML